MTVPMLALRDSGVELVEEDWFYYQWIHTSLLADDLALEFQKNLVRDQCARACNQPVDQVQVVLFTHEALVASFEKHHTEWFGDDPDPVIPRNAAALVAYWKKPLEVTVDDRPRCPKCGTPMNATTAFLCGPGAPGGVSLPPTCPARDCRGITDQVAIDAAIAAGVIDP